jgi:hypothetical protein
VPKRSWLGNDFPREANAAYELGFSFSERKSCGEVLAEILDLTILVASF